MIVIMIVILKFSFLKWGRWKGFTPTASFQLQDLGREVQLFLCGRPREHEI